MEVLDDSHLHERGFLTDHLTEAGTVSLPNSPMHYQGSPLRTPTTPPGLGEHIDQILTELCGFDAGAVAELRRTGVTTPAPKNSAGH